MRTITVKGVGSVSVKPDYITLSLDIVTTEKEYDTAMQKAAQRIHALEAAVIPLGFEKGSIKTLRFNVTTQYDRVKDRNDNCKRVFAGYNCTYQLSLSFDFDSNRLADVISAISDSGAKPGLSIDFTVKDTSSVREDLLISATENARSKAEILCRASGTTLGELQTINYSWSELNIVSPTDYSMEDALLPIMKMNTSVPDIEPDDIDVHDSATFVWAIS